MVGIGVDGSRGGMGRSGTVGGSCLHLSTELDEYCHDDGTIKAVGVLLLLFLLFF